MKRLICLILLAVLFLPGCDTQEEEFVEPVNFYFVKANVAYFSSDGVITKEVREAQGHRQDYVYLLEMYLRGPESGEVRRVFPKNVELVQLELSENSALVILNDATARLTGLDLTIACACLTATVCDMTGVQMVTIKAETQLLDGNKSITMQRDHLLLLDSNTSDISN
jgi:hypothetical protein